MAALAGSLASLFLVLTLAFEFTVISEVMENLVALSILGIPVAIGIAILRYRLYDIDIVINKTVVYGVLAAAVTLDFLALVVGVGTLIGNRSSPFLSAMAAGIAALAFQPVRRRAQAFANRLVYGKRATPYEVLSEFSDRLAGAYSVEDVLPRMARVVAEGTAAASVRVWLRVGGELRPVATWPPADGTPEPMSLAGDELPPLPGGDLAFPVRHRGSLLGAITVTRAAGEPFTPTEQNLLRDVAAQAGLVLENVRLTEELRARLEEISRQAAELRASRQRIVAAQDEERRRLERNIHDGAQQQLVAIGVKLGLAKGLAARDPGKLVELLDQLQDENQQALEDMRDLARGIYPPLLADQGLPAALAAQARKSLVPVTVQAGAVGRYQEDVEAAVYFGALEALQNVAKYANASRVVVRLEQTDGELRFAVEDDGAGFDPATTPRGSGLTNIGDRVEALGGSLEVRSRVGEGTSLLGSVPIDTLGGRA